MRFGELYDRAIEIGIQKDPRGKDGIDARTAELKRRYESLSEDERAFFDVARLTNPFGDTRIVLGDRDTEFEAVLTGIHIGKPEILLAGQLRQAGRELAIVAHHTTMFAGRALASVEDTVWPMVHRLEMVGVEAGPAEQLVTDFCRQMEASAQRALADASTLQMAEAAGVPVISVHTPCDLCHQAETISAMASSATVGEAVSQLSALPEWAFSAEIGKPIEIRAGDPTSPVGKPFFSQAVGWRPPLESGIFQAALEAGADTLVVTEAPPDLVELAQSHQANVVSMPHDMTDVRGMRVLYDMVFEGTGVEIIPCANYRQLRSRA